LQINCDGAHKSANNHKIMLYTLRQVAYDGYVVEDSEPTGTCSMRAVNNDETFCDD
jgi:hypothetical protein